MHSARSISCAQQEETMVNRNRRAAIRSRFYFIGMPRFAIMNQNIGKQGMILMLREDPADRKNENITCRVRLYGIVQGVGFRPAVSRRAREAGIRGTVANKGAYVEVMAQGKTAAVEGFISKIKNDPPVRASVIGTDVQEITDAPLYHDFSIVTSAESRGEIFISPDIAVCDECARELLDPANRRYLHPFINCTACGPRLTILDRLPYDRERTSMKKFPMCPACAAEYRNPASRRYDAQPVCCNACGPRVCLFEKSGKNIWKRTLEGGAAISRVREVVMRGGTAAVKGIGGFHLCCDATNEAAVMRLRKMKNRPAKPFAVMFRDAEAAEQACTITDEQMHILAGHQKPIVLLDRKETDGAGALDHREENTLRRTGTGLADAVAPGNPKVGAMLPYAPVQILLFHYPDGIRMTDALVMTSGNAGGAPICRDEDEALEELFPSADVILSNDRDIRIRCDDSVMDFYHGRPYMIRRSRGYSPLPVRISFEKKEHPRCVLAVGGEIKNTFCVENGDLLYLSPYVGDLTDVRAAEAFRDAAQRFLLLLAAKPEAVISDTHPAYRSVRIAQEIAAELCVPHLCVQHHYAHVLSCMAENDIPGPVLGVSFDGTGYGTDGSIWGGEILLADTRSFRRLASIMPFLQPGGDAGAKEGWRIAGAMIFGLFDRPEDIMARLGICSGERARILTAQCRGRINTADSTSCGRLFDAAAAILGICLRSTYEGEAANRLMFAAEGYARRKAARDPAAGRIKAGTDCRKAESAGLFCGEKPDADGSVNETYPSVEKGGMIRIRTDLIIRELVMRKLDGEDTGFLAWLFHFRLACGIKEGVLRCRESSGPVPRSDGAAAGAGDAETGRRKIDFPGGNAGDGGSVPRDICLTGGCFQNTLLLGMTETLLEDAGFRVFTHSLVPPNDGGISLGQALYGLCSREPDR